MPFPFKRVLAAVDFNDHSLAALDLAKTLAQQSHGTVIVLHVVVMDEPTGGVMYDEDFKSKRKRMQRDLLTSRQSVWRVSNTKSSLRSVIRRPE